MEWFNNDRGSSKSYDIPKLRLLSKEVSYCSGVEEDELDCMLELVVNDNLDRDDTYKVVASVSNVVLVNRQLHIDYYIPKYSNQVLQWCNRVGKEGTGVKTTSFTDLLAVFRIIFLSLYGGLDNVKQGTIDDVFDMLLQGFRDCVRLLEDIGDDNSFQLVLVEILKCLYTLHHKHHYGAELFENEEVSDNCLRIINRYSAQDITKVTKESELLVIKHTFNLLLLLCEGREEAHSEELYRGPEELYTTFFNHIKLQLENHLNLLEIASDDKKSQFYPLFVNSLVVLKHMSKSLVEDLKADEQSTVFQRLHKSLSELVVPYEGSSFIYNQFLQILAVSAFPNLSSNHTFQQMQQLSFIKDGILTLFYNLTYHKDSSTHQQAFFELVGFLNADTFMEKNGISIDPSVDLEKLTHPVSKYLDNSYFERKPDMLNSETVKDQHSASFEMTEEEKEIEAEKLFTLFERMEKLGTFENFQNPVKTWQQEGKFEELNE